MRRSGGCRLILSWDHDTILAAKPSYITLCFKNDIMVMQTNYGYAIGEVKSDEYVQMKTAVDKLAANNSLAGYHRMEGKNVHIGDVKRLVSEANMHDPSDPVDRKLIWIYRNNMHGTTSPHIVEIADYVNGSNQEVNHFTYAIHGILQKSIVLTHEIRPD